MTARRARALFRACAGLILVLLPAGTARAGEPLARFALVAGNDRGARRDATLRYAQRDARRFADLLIGLGGFRPERVELALGEGRDGLIERFERLRAEMRAQVPGRARKALLVVYFSGHSDGLSLELGAERLAFAELRALVETCPAQVKIVFIDACHAGGVTAAKGSGHLGAPGLTLHDHLDASGSVYLTSSAYGESSQESSEVGGAYFTHNLLAALRGAADQDGDGQVDLAEAYAYTYARTVALTAQTLEGVQHPSFEFQLEGRGRVVLTELARAQACLVLLPDVGGRVLIHPQDDPAWITELDKPYGRRAWLALPAGAYKVQLRHGPAAAGTTVDLAAGVPRELGAADLGRLDLLAARQKGRAGTGSGVGLFSHYGLASGALKDFAPLHSVALGLRLDLGPLTWMPRLVFGQASIASGDFRYRMRLFSLDSWLAWRFELWALDLFAGLEVGLAYGQQSLPGGEDFAGSLFSYGGLAGIDLPVVGGLSVQVFWVVGAEAFRQDRALSQKFTTTAWAGLGYSF